MLKKLLAAALAAALVFALAGCGGNNGGTNDSAVSNTDNEGEKNLKTVLNEENAKLMGRTYLAENNTLWCALSGTGAEFEFTGKKLDIMIEGDSVSTSGRRENYARLAIYVDGERVVDDMLNDAVKLYTPIDEASEVTKTVRIIKLSETAMSTIGIMPINLEEGASIRPTQPKEHSIEFIGDSITCGYGVDDEDPNNHFKTETEDVTKAYAYKTAQNLGADHSMFSVSGWGIITGYTDNGEKHEDQRIPPYYEKMGFSYGAFDKTQVQSVDWDFDRYQPEVVVINLGTNDDSYTAGKADREQEYADAYVEFLKTVRKNNPNAHIICSLGIMGGRLFGAVEKAAAQYTEETGDTNISTFKFAEQNGSEDGLAADWHPTEATHEKAAAALTEEIKNVMGW